MVSGEISVVGIGPGSREDMTLAAVEAIRSAGVVVGYQRYFQYVEDLISPSAERIDTGMLQELARAELAFERAQEGHRVCVISSGDAGIYGMAPLIEEMRALRGYDIPVRVIPGVSAMQKAAALLGAPLGHDFCTISLSNLLTPWRLIEDRIVAAAKSDFAIAVYNPQSKDRYWQLARLRDLLLRHRAATTPVGIVRQAGRKGEAVTVTTLGEMPVEGLDMLTIVIIGNSQSRIIGGSAIVTPRGYFADEETGEVVGVGRNIMVHSFKTILSELDLSQLPLGHRWCVLHAVHTTADFEMASLLSMRQGTVEHLFQAFQSGRLNTIVTDVRMVREGIRREAVRELNLNVICYLDDPRCAEMAQRLHITRTQAGMRLAVEEHPDALYVFGNAPTALMELCQLTREGKAHPQGIVAAPVGFVNVLESKAMVGMLSEIPSITVSGRKGGSGLAATIVNAILSFGDAEAMLPGRGV